MPTLDLRSIPGTRKEVIMANKNIEPEPIYNLKEENWLAGTFKFFDVQKRGSLGPSFSAKVSSLFFRERNLVFWKKIVLNQLERKTNIVAE